MHARLTRIRRFLARAAPWVQLAGVLALAVPWAAIESGWIDADGFVYPYGASGVRLAGVVAILVAPLFTMIAPARWRRAWWALVPLACGLCALGLLWACGLRPRSWSISAWLEDVTVFHVAIAAATLLTLVALARDTKRSIAASASGLAAIGALSAMSPVMLGGIRLHDVWGDEPLPSAHLALFLAGASGCAWLAAIVWRPMRWPAAAVAIALLSRATVEVITIVVELAIRPDEPREVASAPTPPHFYEILAITCDVIEAATVIAVIACCAAFAWTLLGARGRAARAYAAPWIVCGVVVGLLGTSALEAPDQPGRPYPWRARERALLPESTPHFGPYLSDALRRELEREHVLAFDVGEDGPLVLIDREATIGALRNVVAHREERFYVAVVPALATEAPRAVHRWRSVELSARRIWPAYGQSAEPSAIESHRAHECVLEPWWDGEEPHISSCLLRPRSCIGPLDLLVLREDAGPHAAAPLLEERDYGYVLFERTQRPARALSLVRAKRPTEPFAPHPTLLLLAILDLLALLAVRILWELRRCALVGRVAPGSRVPILPCWASARDVTHVVVERMLPSYRSSPRPVLALAPPLRSLGARIAPMARWAIVRAGAIVLYVVILALLLRLLD